MNNPETTTPRAETPLESDLRQIQQALRGLKFGSVTIVVQDGCVVQIERLEKQRIRRGELN